MIFKSIAPWAAFFQAVSHFTEANSEAGSGSYTVERISHLSLIKPFEDDSLTQSRNLLLDALSEEGIISVTDIPGFGDLKRDTLTWLHACIMEQGDTNHKLTHKDGTIRRTMASITVPGPGGVQPFKFANDEGSGSVPASCLEFSKKLDTFRKQVDDVIKLFALRLSSEMESSLEKPLLDTEDGSYSFPDIYSIVTEGHHLEHFHSYQKLNNEDKLSTSGRLRNDQAEEETIEMHTDQGFFIAFTPGLMVTHKSNNKNEPDLSIPLEESTGFYIESTDGKRVPVHFDAHDELVFMMGDGVNQYINPKLVRDSNGKQKKSIRATPHKVVLESHDANVARVWYGRMALPPPLAYNPVEKKSHGEIRSLVNQRGDNIKNDNQNIHQGIGCSSPESMRLLSGDGGSSSDITCDDDESIYCWFRCMSLEDQGVSKAECAEQNLQVQCVNPRDQFSNGKKHGDYYPFCSNTTEVVTPYPKLLSYPADEIVCTDDLWNTFSASEDYQYSFDLTTNHTTAKFMWSVLDDKKTVKATIAFRGLFGYISLGFADMNPDARHKGMNGATIIMALPGGGGEYSPKDGLELTKSPTIHEYIIDPKGSSFRHWSTPVSSNTISSRSIDTNIVNYATTNPTECFTSLTIQTDKIHNKAFNTESSNDIIWAANGEDSFAGHHGKNRARFTVDWSSGHAEFYKPPSEDSTPTPAPTATAGAGSPTKTSSAPTARVLFLMTIFTGVLLHAALF